MRLEGALQSASEPPRSARWKAPTRLAAARESSEHEQNILRDVVAGGSRRGAVAAACARQHVGAERSAAADSLLGELESARLALAEERKQRYLAEDRLKVAERRGTTEASRKAQAADLELATAAAENEAKESRIGQMKGQTEAMAAERESLRTELLDLGKRHTQSEKELAEARASLELLKESLTSGGSLPGETLATAEEAFLLLAQDASNEAAAPGAAPSIETLGAIARKLRQRALNAASLEAAATAAEAEAKEMRAMADAAEARTEGVEAELTATKRALQVSDSQLSEAKRDAAVPVLQGSSAEMQSMRERLTELQTRTVPSLEQEVRDLQAALSRSEGKLLGEREAKLLAKSAEAAAKEEVATARAAASMAMAESEAAEKARRSAVTKLEASNARFGEYERRLEAMRVKESAYNVRESEVAEAVGTADVKTSLLEEQARLLTLSLREEEQKVASRDEMLRSLQQELMGQRKRLNEYEQRAQLAQHGASRAEATKRDVEAERNEMSEKLTLAMMEVNARAERLEHSQAQVAAARGEIRALENQLAIASNQLTLTQQQNATLAQSDGSKGAQLASAEAALQGKEQRLEAAERSVGEARAEATARQEELVKLGERFGAVQEERDLLEQQATAAMHATDLLRAELKLAKGDASAARADARDEMLLRAAYEGRNKPLREALAQREADLEEAEERQLARVLLVERLHSTEAQRVAAAEKAVASERRAAAAELRSRHSDERLEIVREELARREAKIAALQQSLGASEEELALLKASKELLAARVQLQDELQKQRRVAHSEELALQTALTMVKDRHLEATDALVRAAGEHAAKAVSAVRDAATQAAAGEVMAGAEWEERMGSVERVHARGEAAMSELHGRLMAARLESGVVPTRRAAQHTIGRRVGRHA